MKKFFVLPLMLIMLSGCTQTAPKSENIVIYTSFYGMSNFTQMIAGDKAEVRTLIPSGVEAHDWEPGTNDMIALNEADVFIYSGMNMEPWAESILESVGNENLTVIQASSGIEPIKSGSASDPHVWLNPLNALKELENITDGLITADGNNKDYYINNFENVKTKIIELDNSFKEAVAKIDDKEVIVTHGAFGYLCDAYGLTQYTLEGLTGNSDPSSYAMKSTIDYIKNNNKKALFYVESEGDKLAAAISKETGAELYPLNPFENNSNGKDYFEVMNNNLQTLKKALTKDE